MTHMRSRFIPRSLCFPPVPEAGAFGAGDVACSAGMDFQAGLSVAL